MNKTPVLLFVLAITFLFSTCKKDDTDQMEILSDEALSPEQVDFWQNQETIELEPFNIMLANGLTVEEFLLEVDPEFYYLWGGLKSINFSNDLGPQDSKTLLVTKFAYIACYLTNRKNFQYDEMGEKRPAQNGLAYVWGGKNYLVRYNPKKSNSICDQELYGLDCSGLVSQLFKNGGVTIPDGADAQRQTKTLENAIKSAYPELKKIKVEDLGKISTSYFESGDIIYWKNLKGKASHIGMVLKGTDGTLAIAQSNGGPNDCIRNLSERCGPRFANLRKAVLPAKEYGFGDDYAIVRINAEISGEWTFYLKCEGQSTDLFAIDLNFPTTENNSFYLTKSAFDYDGSFVTFDFYFTYDKYTNILSCEYTTTDDDIFGFERKDSFSIKLKRDDTGYLIATNQYIIGGGGCTNEVRLINNETMAVKRSLLSDLNVYLTGSKFSIGTTSK